MDNNINMNENDTILISEDGESKEAIETKPKLDSDPIMLARPRNNCTCNGTGRLGYDSNTHKGIPCKCLFRLPDTAKNGEVLYLTYGEWKEINKERDTTWDDMKKRKREYRRYKKLLKRQE